MNRVKIVHLITALPSNGAEMMLYKLLSGMNQERFENVVISLRDKGQLGPKIEALGIPVYTLDMSAGRPTPGSLARLVGLLRRERPRILQTWMYHADLMGLVAGQIARVPNIIWNLRCSDIQHTRRSTVLTVQACARLSGWPRLVLSNSEAGRVYHEKIGYHPRQWKVIPNGFELGRFAPNEAACQEVRAELGLPADTLLIGVVGRYDPVKDHRNFLEAALQLYPHWPEVHYLMIGSDIVASNQELGAPIRGQAVEKNIHMLGERRDIARVMAALDIATSSSYSEGFANVIGEAMACAVPCVVTDAGDSARVVGDSGLVVPIRNPQALAEGWEQLIKAGPEKRRELGRAARNRVSQHYSLERIVQLYEELYSAYGTKSLAVVGA